MDSSSVTVRHSRVTRTADDMMEREESASFSYSAKKTRMSSAYEADESFVYSDTGLTDVASESKVSWMQF